MLCKPETLKGVFVTGGMFPDVVGVIHTEIMKGYKTGPILADPTKSPLLHRGQRSLSQSHFKRKLWICFPFTAGVFLQCVLSQTQSDLVKLLCLHLILSVKLLDTTLTLQISQKVD